MDTQNTAVLLQTVDRMAAPAGECPPDAAFYRRMALIRRFEENLLELFAAGKLMGTTHTCSGQEANAVGVIAHLAPQDVVFSSHRCHGHYLARTGDAEGLLAELLGLPTGICGGKGGSQHLCRGSFYTNGVQGGIVPLAVGAALAEKRKGTSAIAAVWLGDGTLGEGVVYESFNMASLWKAPVLFVVENNRYAQTTPVEMGLAGTIRGRPEAFAIPTAELDTTDPREVWEAARDPVAAVRGEGRPFCLVLHTYRFGPHSKGDDFRPQAEVAAARARDPLLVTGRRLDPEERERIDREVAERIAAVTARLAGGAPEVR
ncbi:MAG: thiamine pyrophosphate-dependent dehydrogenase E1 component subunit alpha [Planctomycetes bacterium]|nr:thiamine pyrophosphate-dependent dehydrogenase E1 component subunit alpha [Planctomycetota bacterium]